VRTTNPLRRPLTLRLAAVVLATLVLASILIVADRPPRAAAAGERDGATLLSSGVPGAMSPAIAADGSTLHAVWADPAFQMSGRRAISYRRSLDGGATWEPARTIGNHSDSRRHDRSRHAPPARAGRERRLRRGPRGLPPPRGRPAAGPGGAPPPGGPRGDREAAERWFDEARSLAARCQSPLDVAQVHLALGAHLRRRGSRKAAIEELRLAHQGCSGLRAAPWLERTDQELAACNARLGPRDDSRRVTLTAQEQAVVRLVQAGRRNREIAAELYISIKTVEYHLSSVYRKLGVRSRTELVHLLSEQAG